MAEKKQTKKTEKMREQERKTEKENPKKVKAEKIDKKAKSKNLEKTEKENPAHASKKNPEEIKFEMIHLRPLITEKAVMLIEAQNVMTFETTIDVKRDKIKKEVEEIFETKVENVRTLIRRGKKYAYVKLNPKNPAIDIATKLGMI